MRTRPFKRHFVLTHINTLTRDTSFSQELELSAMKEQTFTLKHQLGESETQRYALESEKLRLSLQNMTRAAAEPVVAPTVQYQQPAGSNLGANISNACSDISEVCTFTSVQ